MLCFEARAYCGFASLFIWRLRSSTSVCFEMSVFLFFRQHVIPADNAEEAESRRDEHQNRLEILFTAGQLSQ